MLHWSSLDESKFNQLFLLKCSVFATKKAVVAESWSCSDVCLINYLLYKIPLPFPSKKHLEGREGISNLQQNQSSEKTRLEICFYMKQFHKIETHFFSKLGCDKIMVVAN